MPEPPRRKRFQIHLSTAIVMMFVAGALIWANTIKYAGNSITWGEKGIGIESLKRLDIPEAEFKRRAQGEFSWHRLDECYGWPEVAYTSGKRFMTNTDLEVLYLEERMNSVSRQGIIADTIVASAVLLYTAFVCEWLIRRLAARKGA